MKLLSSVNRKTGEVTRTYIDEECTIDYQPLARELVKGFEKYMGIERKEEDVFRWMKE